LSIAKREAAASILVNVVIAGVIVAWLAVACYAITYLVSR
jgi:hypothetical protein